MILTCPSCATRYFVKDDAVPPAGRTVRCAGCGGSWRATPEPGALEITGEPTAAAEAAAPLPMAYRAKVAAQRQTRRAVAAGVVWAGLSAAFAVTASAAVLFRVDVVRAFPRANAAYAAVRMPVNPTGLALEGVQGGPGLENGRQVLVVTGALRNVETAARAPAVLRVSLFEHGGRRAVAALVRPSGGEIGPGETRAFRAVFLDPPIAAAEFGVDFAWDVPAPGRRAAPHPSVVATAPEAAAPPRGPVAQAQALPADSPYALAPTAARPTAAATGR